MTSNIIYKDDFIALYTKEESIYILKKPLLPLLSLARALEIENKTIIQIK